MSTILLVDDEKILRTLLRFALERRGHRVIEAASAGRAISRSSKYRDSIDLLVAAVSLPGKSGVDLCELLRAERPAMRTLLLSRAPHSEQLLEEARASGNQVFEEPFEIEEVLHSIETALASRRRRPPARSGRPRGTARQASHVR